MRRHIIISGTGRAGTTFLVQLLTRLGLETGYSWPTPAVDPICLAGLEHDLREPDAPYICKHPAMCEYLPSLLDSGEVVVDHAIIPMRDLRDAATSRRRVQRLNDTATDVAGGLVGTTILGRQEQVLAVRFYDLVFGLVRHGVPITFIEFPRSVEDSVYLLERLRTVAGLLAEITPEQFATAFADASRPEQVHFR